MPAVPNPTICLQCTAQKAKCSWFKFLHVHTSFCCLKSLKPFWRKRVGTKKRAKLFILFFRERVALGAERWLPHIPRPCSLRGRAARLNAALSARTPPPGIGRPRSHSAPTRQGSRSLAPPAPFSPRLARKAGNVEREQRTPRPTVI
jgi:hypothetical protein